MKRMISALSVILTITFTAAQAKDGAARMDPSPATQRITAARQTIADKPAEYNGYNLLAAALISRARRTSDSRLLRSGRRCGRRNHSASLPGISRLKK